MELAADIILKKLSDIEQLASLNSIICCKSVRTMPHSFDLTLENEGYPIGKVLEC